jgi:hypothetical protein
MVAVRVTLAPAGGVVFDAESAVEVETGVAVTGTEDEAVLA